MLPQLVREPDYSLVNPASVDLRIGRDLLFEVDFPPHWRERRLEPDKGFSLAPGDFVLVSTEEHLSVPNGYAVEFRLKSTAARMGFEHALAVWFDPGWDGVATLELRNGCRYQWLNLYRGQRIVQFMVHKLDGPSEHPYQGRYNQATSVEAAKLEATDAR